MRCAATPMRSLSILARVSVRQSFWKDMGLRIWVLVISEHLLWNAVNLQSADPRRVWLLVWGEFDGRYSHFYHRPRSFQKWNCQEISKYTWAHRCTYTKVGFFPLHANTLMTRIILHTWRNLHDRVSPDFRDRRHTAEPFNEFVWIIIMSWKLLKFSELFWKFLWITICFWNLLKNTVIFWRLTVNFWKFL